MMATALRDMKGMKERELVALGPCAACGKPLLTEPLIYCVTISRACHDASAVRRRVGLEMQIGPLAAMMGPDEDLAKIVDGPVTRGVHESCAGDIRHLFMLFPEVKDEDAA